MFITSTNENHFQFAQYGYFEVDLIKEYHLKPAPFMVYVLIKNRLALSIKNKKSYHDNKGYFVNYSQTSLGNDTSMTAKTVGGHMDYLKEIGLIDFDHDKVGKSYRIRVVSYDYKHKRQVKTYDSECFDLDSEIKSLTAKKQELIDEKITLMNEINKLKAQAELQQRCLDNVEKSSVTDIAPADVPTSTSEVFTEGTTVISTDELSIAITSNLKRSIYPSILKDLENIIKSNLSQVLNSKHDGLIGYLQATGIKPVQEQHDLVSKYYRDAMGYHDLVIGADSDTIRMTDTFFDNIMDMHFASSVRVKGVDVHKERVRAVLARMDHFQMQDVISDYMNLTVKVNDHNTYIKSMIYNSILSFEAKRHNEYKHGQSEYYKKMNQLSKASDPKRNIEFWDCMGVS